MTHFDTQNGSPKPPKIDPKSTQDPLFFRLRFPTVFPSVSGRFFLDFRGAGPSFLLLFTAFPWGAPFFKVRKNTKKDLPTTTKITLKMQPDASKSASKNEEEPIAIVINSGNANAFTGKEGTQAIEKVVSEIAENLKISKKRILMASTGVIGEPLPYKKIIDKIPALTKNLTENQVVDCAKAIMTTDTYPKLRFKKFKLDKNFISILGIAKGSGMIAPNMATMLSFIITDIKISYAILQKITSNLSDKTFNSITVDSDTSTSDMVLVSTTSSANMKPIKKFSDNRIKQFSKTLELVMKELAIEIVKDGEGSNKLIEYQIIGALNDKSAKNIALSIANSPLVKTAIAGEDPNWGELLWQ